ncbi:MAG: hypothetical protein U1F50_00825 [Rubrivivax sp.]
MVDQQARDRAFAAQVEEGMRGLSCGLSGRPWVIIICPYNLPQARPWPAAQDCHELPAFPKPWHWPGQARLALSVVVNVEEGAEGNVADGDKYPEPVDEMGIALKRPVRNYGNESNYRYGLTRGAPRVMRLLERYGIRATFTACALALERAPSSRARSCARAARSPRTAGAGRTSSRWTRRRSAVHPQGGAVDRGHHRPQAARLALRYLLTANTRRLLAEEGFLYHMDDYGDDEPRWKRPPAGRSWCCPTRSTTTT